MSRELKPYPEYKDSGVEWIGEVPEKWETVKLKYVFKLVYRYPNYYGISYVSNGVMEIRGEMLKGKGKIDFKNLAPRYISEETSSRFPLTRLEVGDIVMSVRGTMGKIGLIDNLTENSNITANLLRLSPRKHVTFPKYLTYLMESNLFLEELKNYSNKTTIMTITVPNLLNIDIPVPNTDLQKEISDYLDQKTSEIDALIADKEKMITLLEEKRQAVITETVTKGLDPNVKMKDSGIEWIGEIPAHWEVVKVGHAFYITLGKMIQPTLKNNNEKQVPYLKAQNIQNNYISYESVEKMFASPSEVDKYNIEKGDLLVCEGGEVARSAIAEESLDDYIFQNALHRVRGSKNGNLYYLHYLLNIVRSSGYIDILVNRATIAHFTRDKFSSLKIPLPSYSEQNKIIEYLNKEVNDIKSVQQIIIEQISKLKEYRESLIYEAVTGKIDLRNYKKVGETSESY